MSATSSDTTSYYPPSDKLPSDLPTFKAFLAKEAQKYLNLTPGTNTSGMNMKIHNMCSNMANPDRGLEKDRDLFMLWYGLYYRLSCARLAPKLLVVMGVPQCEPFETFDDWNNHLKWENRQRFREISALWVTQHEIPGLLPKHWQGFCGQTWPKIRNLFVTSFLAAGLSDQQIQECAIKCKEYIRKETESRHDFWAGVGVYGW